jgi:hypothetical protein
VSKDPVRKTAARTATLIAIPIALLVAGASLWTFGAFDGAAPEPSPSAVSPAPTTAVSMAAPSLAPDAAEVCRAVVAELPDTLLGATRRPVTAGPEQNAAYGEPPVTLACGMPAITELDPTDMVNRLGAVCWFGKVSDSGTVWTTLDRTVAITVTVPGAKDGSAQSVIPFSPAIAAADPATSSPPPGCTA